MTYEVSQRYYFRETGQTKLPGQTIELEEDKATELNRQIPGLLKPTRLTMQAHAKAINSAPKAEEAKEEAPAEKEGEKPADAAKKAPVKSATKKTAKKTRVTR